MAATISLSKPLSLLSPLSTLPSTLPPSLSSHLPTTPPPSSPLSLSLHSRFPNPSSNPSFRLSALRSPPGNVVNYDDDGDHDEDDDEEEFVDYEGYESDGTDESYLIDEQQLDAEAIDVVKEFSRSLSRQLSIEDQETSTSSGKGKGEKQKRHKIVPKIMQIPDHLLPRVAIVGRPNVGKSALFNRLVGGNRAIVVDEPGVTRDRLYGRSFWGDQEFMVVDTGGVVMISNSQEDVVEDMNVSTTIGMEGIPLAAREAAVARMPSQIERQAARAIEESSVIVFVVDGQAGPTAGDVEIADWLRKNYSDKNVILAVNKCESPGKGLIQASEFWSFGLSPLPISAISGTGTGELLDLVCSGLERLEDPTKLEEEENYIPSIAIVGRPNVGKSSILNALVGEDRTIVSPVSGTTRDAIDTEFTTPDGQKFRLVDTAGIRRKAAVASSGSTTEGLSVNRALRAIRRSDVVALVIEAMACITEQDCRIAERIEVEGKGCLIVVNKWDTIPNKNHQTAMFYEEDVRRKLRSLHWAPIVYASAISGQSVDKIIAAAVIVEKERSRRLSTATLNQVVREAVAFKAPPRTRAGKRGRVFYCTQAAIRPPTFVFFVNDAKLFPETYRRYMEKQLRTDAGFAGTPIRLLWRSRRKTEKQSGSAATRTRSSALKNRRKEAVAV